MNNSNVSTKRVLPIKFSRLTVGSKFQIFAEPTRDIRKSNDPSVYLKDAEAYSTDITNPDKAIILYPDDLVIPLSRGQG